MPTLGENLIEAGFFSARQFHVVFKFEHEYNFDINKENLINPRWLKFRKHY
jgi:hypothetical protein